MQLSGEVTARIGQDGSICRLALKNMLVRVVSPSDSVRCRAKKDAQMHRTDRISAPFDHGILHGLVNGNLAR